MEHWFPSRTSAGHLSVVIRGSKILLGISPLTLRGYARKEHHAEKRFLAYQGGRRKRENNNNIRHNGHLLLGDFHASHGVHNSAHTHTNIASEIGKEGGHCLLLLEQ